MLSAALPASLSAPLAPTHLPPTRGGLLLPRATTVPGRA